uniref:CS domain-containing protein n=1 Tax=Coccolithus braarudii TaxID=221442 RepID=A0A7S0Q2B8_9EUKA|mmetsp:Transcript_39955/g.85268  ORF Transcript_39955/g.85268 Transcript_39955/m.85268 type:complete len:539 (+) Transcript_39955:143-1759(+)|eukprot:CAMPEP_0183337300 /NCGR_PEP_ID=MMETSP0164_2-20130417/4994_1 /TAXON_ID=221442 /ORGANISM="Coccolithus pelagicus ssp braarudi, Strain PLY182g" /LENGTH=538 /DNA_ID=CAMNT_0025506967 /DNA_START=89 /DNA_END=1705 /DNA_ORIENTATION=+
MLHVPGTYAGGSGSGFDWTQTKREVELRVPLPPTCDVKSVKCEIGARRVHATWRLQGESATEAEAEMQFSGELHALVVMDDSLWSLDKEGASATAGPVLVASLRKVVPELWRRLLTSETEAGEEPALLDGLQRAAPRSKEELLKQAKQRANGMLDGPSKAVAHVIEGKRSVGSITLSADELPSLAVLTLRSCSDLEVVLPHACTVVKLALEGCEKLTLRVDGKVLTETLEVYQCSDCRLELGSSLKTVQVDACRGIAFSFAKLEHFQQLLSAGAYSTSLILEESALHASVDLDEQRALHPAIQLSDETDQFITRLVDGGLLTELVIRLSNDFPTTEREAAAFAERTKAADAKLEEVVGGMLGSTLGNKLTDAEKEQMSSMAQQKAESAALTQGAAAASSEGRHAARVEHKKKAGNEAFKANEYQQAAVSYTEALALCTLPSLQLEESTLLSNRAACFLKLGRYAQAHADAQKCVSLRPDFAKGHFRLALALQAEEKYGDACLAFNRVLQLEPKNKEAASGMRIAEVQSERQRRTQASS